MLRLEVNLNTLKNNLRSLKKLTYAKICAVVKADVYGLGVESLSALSAADEFAVSSIGEAEEVIRRVNKPVNILSSPDKTLVCRYMPGIYPTVSTEDDIDYVSCRGAVAANIKVNTGMNRYGCSTENLEKLFKALQRARLGIKSVYSHIYDLSAAEIQFERFDKCTKTLKDYIPQRHILSGNFTVLPQYMHLDMVRPGLVLYGYGHETVKSVVSAKCGVTQVRKVYAGESIGYGHYTANKTCTVAVLGAGYADGVRRIVSSPRYVSISGNLCPVLGQVCMDAFMVDVSGLNVKVGDYAYIICDEYGIESVATSCGTIGYEILTGFGKRVRRDYIYTER